MTDTRKTLYNPDSRFNEHGLRLVQRSHDALLPIFKAFVNEGFSLREIAHVMGWALTDVELVHAAGARKSVREVQSTD